MKKTIDDLESLRKEVEDLQKYKARLSEYESLLKKKKELEEEGTMKSKIIKGIKKTRDHLREKGKQFQDNGEKLGNGGIFDTPISRMNKTANWESPLSKELTKKGKKK